MAERRSSRRHPLQATACMLLTVGGQEREYLPLTTVDVSPRGAYVVGSEHPPVGTRGEIEIVLRLQELGTLTGHDQVIVRTGAQVVRHDRQGFGVAFVHNHLDMLLAS